MDNDVAPEEQNTPEIPERIAFENAFFHSIKDTSFRTLEDTGEPVMIMVLENDEVSLPLRGISKELKLEPNAPDAVMLSIVTKSLKYVQEIRIGEKVPSELTTGHASWEVTDEHRAIAHNRVTMQLVSWMSGDELLITDPDQLAQVADDPKTKEKINNAFSEAAKALGLEEDRREDVIALIANLANELSYIEALRDKFHAVERIYENVNVLEQKYISQQSVRDIIVSIRRLFLIATRGFTNSFEQLDAQTGEILSALNNIATVTRYIRENRDDLHRRLWAWESLIEAWQGVEPKRSSQVEKLLDGLYHFLAQRFLPREEWELYSKAMDKTKMRSTEVVW